MKTLLDKTILITGGTGSFGSTVLNRLLSHGVREIRIFSRDEKKQHDLRILHNDERLKFYIGDVRDKDSIKSAMQDVNYVFHAAALKQVPSCEFYPLEATKTNVIGTSNVIDCGIEAEVEKIICLSTDKAVYPINAMGISKALMEKVFVAKSRESSSTVVCGTRYGNVMASRGSVIPHFYNQIKNGLPPTITEPQMTRFMMTLDDAVELVLFAFVYGETGDIFVQKSPSCTIEFLAKTMLKLYKSNLEPAVIGARHSEKMHETLLSKEERIKAVDLGNYFKIPADNRDLNYNNYFSSGINEKLDKMEEYNSYNTNRLSEMDLISLLKKIGYGKI